MGKQKFRQVNKFIKNHCTCLKSYLRHSILACTLLFVVKALLDHWQEVAQLRIDEVGWIVLGSALGVTLVSHLWAAWVWLWILQEFNQSVDTGWGIRVFLTTNIAKYLPGNIWHFWGRIKAASEVGIPLGVAALSVLLEPLLMAADGLLIAVMGSQLENRGLQVLSLVGILGGIHPRILNPILQYLGRVKLAKGIKVSRNRDEEIEGDFSAVKMGEFQGNETEDLAANFVGASQPKLLKIKRYPLLPLLGEIGFIGLRGSGFGLTLAALTSVSWSEVPQLLSAFSFAYVLGLVVPGAPGGVGVFEATAIALLSHRFSPGILVSAVAVYRVISILAEVMGAGLAWMSDRTVKS